VGSLGGTPAESFSRAFAPREFVFPADHGPHPGYQTEWWYFAGNLATATGRRFGYQLTLFRFALAPPGSEDAGGDGSSWDTDQLYMAHFGLTDAEGGEFYSLERFSRGAVGLAGAQADPFRVWLENWSVTRTRDAEVHEPRTTKGLETDPPQASAAIAPLTLQVTEEGIGVELALRPIKPIILHGDQGLSRKGSQPGNASYYYSITRFDALGEVEINGERLAVAGSSWLDREWSTSVLEEGQIGWDWFSLQLDDGRDLMYFQLRRSDGSVDPASSGTLVSRDGTSRSFPEGKVEIRALETWESPATGATYPIAWRILYPAEQMDLEVRPLLPQQEHANSFAYWEGAVVVQGSAAGKAATGRGYVELTGYATMAREESW
jgi:predicted secreted hydrolase